ncbi:hypothetical protein NW762_013445 [Fusarium torreyae]|uniref:Uncharacterized protein n=1 Tax=Fusarium torreyae TaxID=1237075 RepID=A0A9W8RNX4_9HYPO|nr:hypothetical protein NW762_013445 [Fusarium torreyae]
MHRADNLIMKTIYTGLSANPDGPYRNESDEQMPLAILNKSKITPPESDPFGSFERATLECRCYLIPLDFDGVKGLERFKEVSSSNGKVLLSIQAPNDEDGPFGLPNLFGDADGENGPFGIPGIKLAALRSRKERDPVDTKRSDDLSEASLFKNKHLLRVE